MTSVVIDQADPAAVPGALVAAWLLAELTEHGEFPQLSLSLDPAGHIVVEAQPGERDRVAAALSRTLTEPRFDGWLLRSD